MFRYDGNQSHPELISCEIDESAEKIRLESVLVVDDEEAAVKDKIIEPYMVKLAAFELLADRKSRDTGDRPWVVEEDVLDLLELGQFEEDIRLEADLREFLKKNVSSAGAYFSQDPLPIEQRVYEVCFGGEFPIAAHHDQLILPYLLFYQILVLEIGLYKTDVVCPGVDASKDVSRVGAPLLEIHLGVSGPKVEDDLRHEIGVEGLTVGNREVAGDPVGLEHLPGVSQGEEVGFGTILEVSAPFVEYQLLADAAE